MSRVRANVRQDGDRVLLLIDGKLVADIPHQAALELANALRSQAKAAEEWANAVRIAQDQAVLMRSGAPFGLTDHPAIITEARAIAQHDRNLRRYMRRPGGIRTGEAFGRPSVRHLPRTPR